MHLPQLHLAEQLAVHGRQIPRVPHPLLLFRYSGSATGKRRQPAPVQGVQRAEGAGGGGEVVGHRTGVRARAPDAPLLRFGLSLLMPPRRARLAP